MKIMNRVSMIHCFMTHESHPYDVHENQITPEFIGSAENDIRVG